MVQFEDEKLLDISALDLEFKILRSLKPSPNHAVLKFINMNADHRAALLHRNKPTPTSNPVPINVQIEAGYRGRNSVLLSADMREAASARQHTDWITTVSMDDGGNAARTARLPKGGIQFTKGTAIATALGYLCDQMVIGTGNVAEYQRNAEIFGWGTTLPHGMTFTGSAWDALLRLCKSIGINVSIQGGALQFLTKGKPVGFNPNNPRDTPIDAILLSPDTGLLDSPEAAIDSTVSLGFARTASGKPSTPKPPKPKDTGILKVKSLLIPGLTPGRVVKLESDVYKGNLYEISEVEYIGQTWGKDWMAAMVLRSYLT